MENFGSLEAYICVSFKKYVVHIHVYMDMCVHMIYIKCIHTQNEYTHIPAHTHLGLGII